MRNNKTAHGIRKGLFVLAMLASAASQAQTINFAQSPAGASAREPAPNVIVSVDDSGSMGPTGMATLREALTTTFGIGSNLTDDRIRLAWQSMNRCPTLGSSTAACGNYNGMRYLSGTHRTNFDAWARGLVEGGGTPSHLMMDNAGQYLMGAVGTNANSPWAANPGTTLSPVLSCRKNFHIFMTDGGWNSGTSNTNQHVDTSATNNGTRIVRGGGNADNTNKTLPDGTPYDATTASQTRLYRDAWGGATTNSAGNATTLSTLSDLAFHYWSTDLQTGLDNNVRATMNRTTTETFVASTGASTILDPFWNPRNNPATWQNMVNYTIGFNTAAAWTGLPTWGGDTFSGDLPNLINGVTPWPTTFCGNANTNTGNRPCDGGTGYSHSSNVDRPVIHGRRMDLWHAALNSRGIFVPAPNAQALVNAFQTILNDILVQTARPLVSIATTSARASANNYAYVAGYDSTDWSGTLKAFAINRTTSRPATTPTWQAQALLDARSNDDVVANRVILTHNGTSGRGFRWDNLSSNQQLALRGSESVPAGTGTSRVNYLRGDHRLESNQTAAGGYMRNRSSRMGDIVNSNIWSLGTPKPYMVELDGHSAFRATQSNRTPTLYVGANDGMLHAFNALTGEELMAYVPAGLFGTTTLSPLRDYTSTAYSHRYMVDGSPFTGDVNVAANTGGIDWRTLLVGTLGAGGKGYFVLDVTNASGFVDPGTGTSNVVRLDTTASTEADIGHVFAPPVLDDDSTLSRSEQIVRVNASNTGGRWAVILGNGYNSSNQRPVLIVQYLDGSMERVFLPAMAANGVANGLGAPRPIDLNGDGKMDIVYAGDLQGNLWKFDISSARSTDWGVAFSGAPLFVARDPLGTVQPITTAPLWKVGPNSLGGIQVLFGTGVNMSGTDPASTQVQTIYSVWDNTQYTWDQTSVSGTGGTVITAARSTTLVEQTQVEASANGRYFETSTNGVTYSRSPSTQRGWFFDLPVSRERVLVHPKAFEGQLVRVDSVVPASGTTGETCDFSVTRGTGYISIFNIYSGNPPKTEVFGADNGNRVQFNASDSASVTDLGKNSSELITPETTCAAGDTQCYQCTPGVDCPSDECLAGEECDDGLCGGLNGRSLSMCLVGAGGRRADWREMR